MTKLDLLAQLPLYPRSPKAVALAKQTLSDDDIGKLTRSLQNRKKKCGLWDTFNATLMLLVGAVFLALAAGIAGSKLVHLLWGTVLVMGSASLNWWFARPLLLLPLLAPLKGTELCELALQAVSTGGPNVAEWRRIALAERNQLYNFDYTIMYILSEQHSASQQQAARQEALDTACRALHEVP